jgi:beta-galactosidase GanA
MELLKKKGFNLIKIQTHWATDEVVEGHYDFSEYDYLVEKAQQLDMYVYIGLTCEQAPSWLYRKFPDCRMVGRNGVPIIYDNPMTVPADGKPGPCFLHKGALDCQNRYVAALVRALGRHANIVVWSAWQEIPNWRDWSVGGQPIDYNANTIDAFRVMLKKSYGDLDGLNRHWSTSFGSWDEVEPNRETGIGLPQEVDWRTFIENTYIARVLEDRRSIIKREDSRGRPVFAHLSYPVIGSTQNWTHARALDFLGSSYYPAWGSIQAWDDGEGIIEHGAPQSRFECLFQELFNGVLLSTDYLRSSSLPGAPIWAAEMQGGPVAENFHKGRVPDPADIRRWMIGSVSSGATATCFWVTRAEIIASENNGYSLLDSRGDSTPRFEEAARVGKALMRYPEIFARATRPHAKVGIVVDENNYQFCASLADQHKHLAYDIRGWHRMLCILGYPVDFVDGRDVNADAAGTYSVLIVPFMIAPSSRLIGGIESYVNAGGHAVCEAAIGRIDERGFAVRGEMPGELEKLFGVRQASFQLVREPDNEFRWSPHPRTWGEYADCTYLEAANPAEPGGVLANYYLQTFESTGGEPLLTVGHNVAAAVRNVGKGSATVIGTFLGYSGTAHRSNATPAFIDRLLRRFGISPQRLGDLVYQTRSDKGKTAYFFLNLTPKPVREDLAVPSKTHVSGLFGEPLHRDGDEIRLEVEPLDYLVLVVDQPAS